MPIYSKRYGRDIYDISERSGRYIYGRSSVKIW